MPFRPTGIDTPFGGFSWEYTTSPNERIKELFFFLESRRILTNPAYLEVTEQCAQSAIEIREALLSVIKNVDFKDNDILVIRAMIDESNKFLDEINIIEGRVTRFIYRGVNVFEFSLSKYREAMIAGIKYFEREYKLKFSKDLSNQRLDWLE